MFRLLLGVVATNSWEKYIFSFSIVFTFVDGGVVYYEFLDHFHWKQLTTATNKVNESGQNQ